MKLNFIYILFLFVCLSFSVFSQSFKDDSVQIVSLYKTLLTQPDKTDSCLNLLNNIQSRFSKEYDELKDFYSYSQAKYLLQTGKLDSSFQLSTNCLKQYEDDSLNYNKVKFLNLVASRYILQQNYEKGIFYFEQSLAICEHDGNQLQTAYIKNNIANIFFSLLDYEAVYKYESESFEIIKDFPESPYYSSILSILSVAESKIGKQKQALEHAQTALEVANERNDLIAIIVANYALGDIESSRKNFDKAIEFYNSSISISEKYQQHHYTLINSAGLLHAFNGIEEYNEAINYGEKALELAKSLNNSNIQYSLCHKLAKAYYKVGQHQRAYNLLLNAHSIFKETSNAEIQESINDILIKYDSEKKEKEIAEKNLLLAEKDLKTSRFRQIILILSIILITFLLLFFFIRQRNMNKISQLNILKEKETLQAALNGEEIERSRMADELHDGLASTLTSIRFKLEGSETKDDAVIEMIREAQIDTRRIAHNLSPIKLDSLGLISALEKFSRENTSEQYQITIANFTEDLKLPREHELLVYRITQELVQNAMKYSGASQIDIQLMSSDSELRWSIEDNGTGFDISPLTFGNGLTGIKSRIDKMNGEFNIESSSNGTIVQLVIPILNS